MATCSSCGGVSGVDTASGCCDQCACNGIPAPYYNQGGAVQEAHCLPVISQVLIASLSCGSAFVMPACGKTGIVFFPGLAQIQVGSYLWSAVYGYLVVTAFDPFSNTVTVQNECQSVNAAPGTIVPRCSLFNVVGPP